MILIPKGLLRLATLGMVLSTVACNSTSPDSTESGLPAIVATTSIWADITSHVACGEPVESVIPAGADPHTFEASFATREMLEDAGAVVANGGGLEQGLRDLLDTVKARGVTILEMTSKVDLLQANEHDEEAEHGTSEDHGHGGKDPHIWQDPIRVAHALDAIAALVIATGRDRARVTECTRQYRIELEAVDGSIRSSLFAVPPRQRVLVTNHDAFGYFADRYGFEIVGTVIPSLSTLGEASAGQLAELADTIEERHVPAIFTEELASDADAEALADRLDVAVVPLSSDALATSGSASSYTGMLKTNADKIAAALA